MKKFITVVPLQIRGQLGRYHYEAVGNRRLSMEEATSFPILTAVQGYVTPGEASQVIAVVIDTESSWVNLELLKQQVETLSQSKGFPCPELVTVKVPEDESVATHAATFRRLIDLLQEDDELFACLTFGTKPLSEAVRMAVQYAYRVKRNASISCIVYGQISRPHDGSDSVRAYVHDETALLRLDEIVRLLADRKVENPGAVLDGLLAL